MCNSQSEDKRQKRIRAKNLNTHEESGGFHVVEVNSPINMSSSTWLLIVGIIAILLYLYCKKYKREGRKERFRDAGGDPSNKAALNHWINHGFSNPLDAITQQAMSQQAFAMHAMPSAPSQYAAPLPYRQQPALTYDARPAITYADPAPIYSSGRPHTDYARPSRPSNYASDRRPSDYAVPSQRQASPHARMRRQRLPPPVEAPPPVPAEPTPPNARSIAAGSPPPSPPLSPRVTIHGEVGRRMDWDEVKPADQ